MNMYLLILFLPYMSTYNLLIIFSWKGRSSLVVRFFCFRNNRNVATKFSNYVCELSSSSRSLGPIPFCTSVMSIHLSSNLLFLFHCRGVIKDEVKDIFGRIYRQRHSPSHPGLQAGKKPNGSKVSISFLILVDMKVKNDPQLECEQILQKRPVQPCSL